MNSSQTCDNRNNNCINPRNNLLGKVVLLIGNENADLQTLISQLGRRGADVVLVYQQVPRVTLRKAQDQMKALGQNLLLLEKKVGHPTVAADLIATVTRRLGRVDVLIDLSAANDLAVTQ